MASQRTLDAIGMGASAVDMIGVVNHLPKRDAKEKMLAFECHAGGTVANTAVGLSRLGCKSGYLGKLGENGYSKLLIDELSKEGVDIQGLIRESSSGPYLAFIMVENNSGARTCLWTDDLIRPLKPEDLSIEYITSARVLHLDDYGCHDLEATKMAMRSAKDAEMVVVLDGENPQKEEYKPLLAMVDYLIAGQEYALTVCSIDDLEDAAKHLLSYGVGTVAITSGAKGCLVLNRENKFYKPSFKMNTVDTTGCGDAFRAGFIYGLLQDWNLELAIECASAVAALKSEKMGAMTGLPKEKELLEFLKLKGSREMQSKI